MILDTEEKKQEEKHFRVFQTRAKKKLLVYTNAPRVQGVGWNLYVDGARFKILKNKSLTATFNFSQTFTIEMMVNLCYILQFNYGWILVST